MTILNNQTRDAPVPSTDWNQILKNIQGAISGTNSNINGALLDDGKKIVGIRIATEFDTTKHAGTDADPWSRNAITNSIMDLGGAEGTILISGGVHSIDLSLVVPSNVQLIISKDSRLRIATGVTFTINGTLDASLNKIFDLVGTGVVTFGTVIKEFYPEWWGAKGDDVTDDASAINQMALAAAGKVWHFTWVYRIGSTIVISGTNTRLVGSSWASEIKAMDSWTTPNQPMFSVTATGVSFFNLKLNGNRTGRGPVTSAHIVRCNTDNLSITSCWITNDAWEAIRSITGGTHNHWLIADNFMDQGYGGYVIIAGGTRCIVSRNIMLTSTSDPQINFGKLNAPVENIVEGNVVVGSQDVGISFNVAGSARNLIRGNVIIDCVNGPINASSSTNDIIEGNLTKGANASIVSGTKTIVRGNKIIFINPTGTGDGIYTSTDNLIEGNTIENSPGNGISANAVQRVSILNNHVRGSGQNAIRREINIRNGSTDILVLGNVLGGGGPSLDWGILIEHTGTDRIRVIGNVVQGYTNAILKTSATGNDILIADNPGYNPIGVTSITVTASPFTYINTDGLRELVSIDGGTVTTVTKNGITLYNFGATAARCAVWLEPGEALIVTYTVAPTMNKDKK